MTKIKNLTAYQKDTVISDMDFVIGSDGDSIAKTTKNFFFGDIRSFVNAGLAPEVGGTLKYTEITNNTGAFTTPADLANSLIPSFTVLQYNIVVFTVNGNRYLLKLQDIAIGSVETPITNDDFITIIGFSKIGDGQGVLKGYNETTKLHEYYSLKSDGNDISIVADNILINPKEGVNLGDGQEVYKGLNGTTKLHEFYNLKSNTQKIELIGNNIFIDTPETSTIPALYVNNLYVPTEAEFLAGNTKGEGTLAKPFTDTVTAYVLGVPTITANTSIQNGLDAYVGSGTRLLPQRVGQKIIVQDNNLGYTFPGNFSYTSLNLKVQAFIQATTTGLLVDMDNSSYFDSESSQITIDIAANYELNLVESLGFNNSGNTNITNDFSTARTVFLIGDGLITTQYNGANVLTNYILNGNGNSNNANLHFQVRCPISTTYQGIYNSKNFNRTDFYNTLTSGAFLQPINTSLKAFHQTGGQIRFFEKGTFYISTPTGSFREYGITFEPTDNGIGYFSFELGDTNILYHTDNVFAKLNNESVQFSIRNTLGSGQSTNLFENLGGTIWGVDFKNNTFSLTSIDFTKVDLTQGNNVSSTNFIGNNVVESLVVYDSKQSAKSASLPSNSVFLKRVTKTAGAFVVGQEYRIFTIGTTDYTLIGASANTVGLYFTATGVGTGTGTAYIETREMVI